MLVLPLSIVRWISFSHPNNTTPEWATFSTNILFSFMGFVNVVLFLRLKKSTNLVNFDAKESRSNEFGLVNLGGKIKRPNVEGNGLAD